MLNKIILCVQQPICLAAQIPTLLYQFGLLLVVFGVLFLSVSPFDEFNLEYLSNYDKLNHITAFFVLALLAKGAMPSAKLFTRWGGLLFYGVLIEVIQSVIPYRFADYLDFAADLLGIAAFELLYVVGQAVLTLSPQPVSHHKISH